MYTPLEKYLLSAPVLGLNLPALIEPTERELMERQAVLGWNRDNGIGELIFTLRMNGTVVLFANEISQVYGGRYVSKDRTPRTYSN